MGLIARIKKAWQDAKADYEAHRRDRQVQERKATRINTTKQKIQRKKARKIDGKKDDERGTKRLKVNHTDSQDDISLLPLQSELPTNTVPPADDAPDHVATRSSARKRGRAAMDEPDEDVDPEERIKWLEQELKLARKRLEEARKDVKGTPPVSDRTRSEATFDETCSQTSEQLSHLYELSPVKIDMPGRVDDDDVNNKDDESVAGVISTRKKTKSVSTK